MSADVRPDRSTRTSRFDALDGLKALPLLVVLVAHFGLSKVLPGAWIAINHFFIFSGFVIVYLLMVERARTGGISVMSFYRRRARRLLPALFLVMTTVGIWAWAFADPHVRRALQNDMLATMAYVQNWHLVSIADQYFNAFGSPSLLRHAWTLSIEEQFYFVAPWALLIVFAATRRRSRRVLVAAVIAVVSAWWSARFDIATAEGFARVYYGTDVRMQSVLVGVAIALAVGPDSRGRTPRPLPLGLVHAGAWLGFGFLWWLYVSVGHNESWMWDRGGLLLTSIAAAPIILACIDRRPMLFTKVVSARPLVRIGLMTYGLYLWHWPIERWLVQYVPTMPSELFVIVALALTMGVAALSFRYVESRVVAEGLVGLVASRRRGRALAVTTTAAVLVLAMTVGRVPSLAEQIETGDAPRLVAGTPDYEPRARTTRIAVFGDSTARFLFDERPHGAYEDLEVVNLAVPGCDLVRTDIQWTDTDRRSPEAGCLKARTSLTGDLRDADAEGFVVMSGSVLSVRHVDPAGGYLDIGSDAYQRIIEAELDDVFGAAREAGIPHLFVTTVPCRDNNPGLVTVQNIDLEAHYRKHPSAMNAIADPATVNTWLRSWAASRGVGVLDLYEVLGCSDGFTPTLHGVTLYRDYFHFSVDAAAMIWTWLAPELQSATPRDQMS